MAKKLTSNKAKEILHDKSVHGHPLTDKQRKFFGAIAGGAPIKAQKGDKVIIDGKEYDTSSSKYKDLYRFGSLRDYTKGSIGYFDKNGILVTSKMTLPEVVIFPKDKDTKKYYDNLSENQQYVFEQLAKKYGPVNVKQDEGEGIFSGTKGHYNPFSNTITVDPDAHFDGAFISELAHKVQFDKSGKFDVIGDWIFNDLPDYLKGKDPYNDPNTMEYQAHSIIEPKLQDEFSDYRYEDMVGKNYNKFKSGGWLDKYEYGGQAGYTDIPFDYNSAWGGQFKKGGELPQAQDGLWSTNKKAYVDSTLNANKNLDFVKRLYDSKLSIPTPRNIEGWKPGQRSTHLMSYDPESKRVYPEVVNINGKLQYLPGDRAWDYADQTGEFIQFPTSEQAEWFANSTSPASGYKMGTNVLSGINPKTGKPYIQKHAMGGEIPQAQRGSVRCPNNLCNDTGPRIDISSLINNIGERFGVAANTIGQGVGNLFHNKSRTKKLPNNTDYSNNNYYTSEGNPFSSGPGYNNDFRFTGAEYIPQNDFPTYMSDFDFSKFAIPGSVISQPNYMQRSTPIYDDAIASRYMSPETNTGEGIRSGGSQGTPVLPIAAMGGSLPGSVGFTYARTGSIPSNGPYAKKTKASAENGMTYYQHGLDWKPKTISKNGSDIPKNQNAQFILPSESTSIGTIRRDAELLNQLAKRKEFEKYVTNQPQLKQTTKSTPAQEKERLRKNKQYVSQLPNAQIDEQGNVSRVNPNRSVTGAAENFMSRREDKAGEHILGALDAAGYVTGAGELADAGYNALRNAIGESMESGLLSKFKPINIPKSTTIENIVDKTKIIPYTKSIVPEAYDYLEAVKIPSRNLEALSHAQEFAQKYGYEFPSNLERISKSQILTDKTIGGLMNRHNSVVRGVGTNWENLKTSLVKQYGDELGNTKYNDLINSIKEKGIDPYSDPKAAAEIMASYTPSTITAGGRADIPPYIINSGNEGLYTVNSLGSAEGYTHGDGYIVKLKRPTDYSSLNRKDWVDKNLWDYHLDNPFDFEPFSEKVIKTAINQPLPVSPVQYIKEKEGSIYSLENYLSDKPFNKKIDEAENISKKLLNPKYNSIQEDPVLKKHYYDLIDQRSELYNSAAKERDAHIAEYVKSKYPNFDLENKYAHYVFLGKPNEKILEPISSIKITPEKWRQTSRQHFGDYSRGLTRNKQGGVIEDDRGQWAHPGKITKINSNQITMKGVDYPVFGISDTGDTQMMYPEQEYIFKGNTVTEYPQKKKNGGWLDKYN